MNMKNKKKKIYVFESVIIIVGILLFTSVNGETLINSNRNYEIEKTEQELTYKQYFIFGIGKCLGIVITGKSQKYFIYEFGHIIGDIFIQNNQDFGPYTMNTSYILFVKFIETGEIFWKNDLPKKMDVIKFNGFGIFQHYDIPHGPWYAKFCFIGYAEDIEPYEIYN